MQIDKLTQQNVQKIAKAVLEELKDDFLSEIKSEISKQEIYKKRWLRNSELQRILGISSSNLQNLRANGTLPFQKLGGTIYYDMEDIKKVFDQNRIDFNAL
ncbi:MAG: helix-turn-helix domain-containing protein [Psychroflexus halocasei]